METRPKTSPPTPDPRPARVLVVDDDPSVRGFLSRGLRYAGYRVSEAEDGEACLGMVAAEPPDVLILDLMMPGLDGFAVMRRLRERGLDLPVILLSASDERSASDPEAPEPVARMIKPVSFEALLERLEASLRAER